jgi:hypothetical protein
MKPDCTNCQNCNCYHIDTNNLYARIEMLEEAVNMLEDRITSIMADQGFEPLFIDYDLSDEDVQKIKDWLNNEDN